MLVHDFDFDTYYHELPCPLTESVWHVLVLKNIYLKKLKVPTDGERLARARSLVAMKPEFMATCPLTESVWHVLVPN